MSRGFEPYCTNDEARDYFFKKCGFTYDDITEEDISILVLMLKEELKISNKKGETVVNMKLSEKIQMKTKENGAIKYCFLYLNSNYFTRREAISFNEDGFIGFAGWADDSNLNPIKRAFCRWCDYLKDTILNER